MSHLTEQLRARADCIRATDFTHISQSDARDFPDLFDQSVAEIARLQTEIGNYIQGHNALAERVGQLDAAVRSFADEGNWSDRVGCLQWMGKRHAIEYAASVLDQAM